MTSVKRTDSGDPDFLRLVKELDAELAERDGEDHTFYDQFNKLDKIRHVVLVQVAGRPLACGAMKPFNSSTVEIKRMYTVPGERGKGLATQVLAELERWAAEIDYQSCVLETGKQQPEAISLYRKNGYATIPNYGQYAGVDNSVCFEKQLISAL